MTILNPYTDGSGAWLKGALHLHSVNSDGSDTLADVVNDYERLGFDFLAFTDHNFVQSQAELAALSTHTAMLLLNGCEYRGAKWKPELGVIGCDTPLPCGGLSVQEYIDNALASGAFVVFNHPRWVFYHWTPYQVLTHRGPQAIEIYNAVCEELPGSADSSVLWDQMLGAGLTLWGVATDDAHHAPQRNKAWVMVDAQQNGPAVLEALKAGRFYASTGISLDRIGLDGETLHVESGNAESISFITRSGCVAKHVTGHTGSYDIQPKDVYVRVELHGAAGRRAWTNPLIIESDESALSRVLSRRLVEKKETNGGRADRLLMFDFDGVIADTREQFREGLAAACRTLGYNLVQDRTSFLRLFDDNMIEGLQAAGVRESDIAPLLRALGECLDSAHTEPFPGMVEMLNFLAELHPVYIISSNLAAVVASKLDQWGVRGIRAVLGADDESRKAAKIHGLIDRYPEHIPYYTGDTRGDMIEGRLATARTVAVGWGWHDEAKLRAAWPDYFAADVDALQEILT
jgi:phosphoglycolate phosphatase-like HAD superfamily hydrolase